jgi:chemotaxis protein histidine kinase CheA
LILNCGLPTKSGEQDRAAKESVHPDPLAKNSPTPRLDLLPEDLMETIVRIQEVTDDIDLTLEDTDQTVGELNRTAKQMQTSLTQVRMRPLTDLVGRFPGSCENFVYSTEKR